MLITHPIQAQADDPAESGREDAERRRRDLAMLDELGDIAMRIARRAGERALEQGTVEQGTGDGAQQDNREAEVAFDRAARTVRGIVALKLRIATRRPAPSAPIPWSRTARVRRLLDWAQRQAPGEPALLDIRREFDARLAARTEGPEFPPSLASGLARQVIAALPEDVRNRIGELDDGHAGHRGPDPP